MAVHTRDHATWAECELRTEWLEAAEEQFGLANAELVDPLVELASYCEEELRGSKVEAMFDRALVIARDTWGQVHPTVAYVLDHQGTYYASREYSERKNILGDQILEQMQALRERAYREAPLARARDRIEGRSVPLCPTFRSSRCGAQIEAALKPLVKAWGEMHPAFAPLRVRIALTMEGTSGESDADEAARYAYIESQYERALAIATASLGGDHPQTGRIAEQSAQFAWSLQKVERTAQLYEQALAAYTKHFGKGDGATEGVREKLQRLREIREAGGLQPR
jgi:hypothetical protein